MLYWSLTGGADLRWMREQLVSYLRFVAFSAVALGLSACARMHLSDPTQFAIEPMFGDPPEVGALTDAPQVHETDAERIEKLENQMAALDADAASIRTALAVMGPLPDPGAGLVQATFPGVAKAAGPGRAGDSQLYAPAPDMGEGGRSLFYEAELGSFRSKQAAEAGWRLLAGEAGLANVNPRFTETGASTRLTVGPFASEAAVNAMCVDLSALAGACRVTAPVRAY